MKLLLISILVAVGLAVNANAQNPTSFERSSLVIETESGRHKFDIELAVTPDQLSFGLMFRHRLGRDAGMLFDYGTPQKVAMWMRNTYIPLDMLFIDRTGKVVTIAERAVPRSLQEIPSRVPVRGVLELNGGTVSRLKVKIGDIVRHPIFTSK